MTTQRHTLSFLFGGIVGVTLWSGHAWLIVPFAFVLGVVLGFFARSIARMTAGLLVRVGFWMAMRRMRKRGL